MSVELQLDHVVLLLPYRDVVNPPSWIADNFTISPGGTHADGKTENKLILFADGTYLELIAFINDDPEKRRGHWWDKPYGAVDYALTTTADQSFGALSSIMDRLSHTDTGVSYTNPQEGGRLKPDGAELKWRVTFPSGTSRGTVPFFCHDVTPRHRRVPVTSSNTIHPSGAIGMSGVLLEVKGESLHSQLTSATAAILDNDLSQDGPFGVSVPHGSEGAKKPTIRIQNAVKNERKEVSLSLVLQSSDYLEDIHHEIDGGTISIKFERP
ncbi:hypothetical protein DOTSEDRAFT_141842 [Dothistroma septosporum NZE10]|uniref:Glyoxalase-like domain-containing protein n=1 Tax=Dothistroma septosporum (strain NZE10 / CBS 128990) TaxID=675120 RepID=N1Q1X0_DOTSN|nr:hypothetical protein DOTSEDRAFT_141842 [Dothistroma septosporum NZE10]